MARLGSTAAGDQPGEIATNADPSATTETAPAAHPAGDDGNDKLLSLTGLHDELKVQVQADGESEATTYTLTRFGDGTRVAGKHVSAVRKAAESLGHKLRSSTPKD